MVQQWQGDALENNERGRLRRLSDRFPPATQQDSGLGQVVGRLKGVFIDNSHTGRKRKATDEIMREEEEDDEEEEEQEVEEEEEEEEEEDGGLRQGTRSSHGPRKTRFQSSAKQPVKVQRSEDSTMPTTPKRKVPRTKSSTTSPSLVRKSCGPFTPSTGTPSTRTVHNGPDTWAPIRKLQMLELHKSIAMHLERNTERDPALFLNDTGSLLLFQPKVPAVRSIEEGFAEILLYHDQMEHRGMLDRVRTLFMWLFFGDFAAAKYGERCHITHTKAEKIVAALEARLMPRSKMDQKQQEELRAGILKQIPDLHTKGKRLAHLCERFGTGSLFWLADHLTSHL